MSATRGQPDPRRAGLSGLGAISLLLAAVIVLASSPAVLSGRTADPSHPISRVGSQLRRIASAAPVRSTTKSSRRDLQLPLIAQRFAWSQARVGTVLEINGAAPAPAPILSRIPLQLVDLPPPSARA